MNGTVVIVVVIHAVHPGLNPEQRKFLFCFVFSRLLSFFLHCKAAIFRICTLSNKKVFNTFLRKLCMNGTVVNTINYCAVDPGSILIFFFVSYFHFVSFFFLFSFNGERSNYTISLTTEPLITLSNKQLQRNGVHANDFKMFFKKITRSKEKRVPFNNLINLPIQTETFELFHVWSEPRISILYDSHIDESWSDISH